ncbi:MAG: hypothetical protein HDS68_03370 [Bacteroidales bacterium]|nr:hypothetical protein [Bacteroidales bacterium]
MRKLIIAISCALAAGCVFTGCKTTEANYAAAYEIAREKRDAGLTAEAAEGLKREAAIAGTVYNGDSIPLKGIYVKRIEGADAKPYTVVVASFKQLFNSRSVMKRLETGGWNEPVLLQDPRDEVYYVGAMTTASLDSAVSALRRIENDPPLQMKALCPFILRR